MAKQNSKNIILFVSHVKKFSIDDIRAYEKTASKKFRIMLLRDRRSREIEVEQACDIVVKADFNKPHKIAEALQPYENEIIAFTSSSLEKSVPPFAKVIPNVPYLNAPSTESIEWATDKYEMRRRLKVYCPKHTPKFTLVKSHTKAEVRRIIDKIGFPIVIKPANLSASSFVTVSYHKDELEANLKRIFKGISKAYKDAARNEVPKIIAEEFMDGIMFSIDSYVNGEGKVYHCPLVRVKTGKEIGHDDFYNYIRITPTNLKASSIQKAQDAAEAAIHALGLRYTTAHIELMRLDDDWKIIEIGARRGGFREVMYQLSAGINHTMNDVFIRIPKTPVIPKKLKSYVAMMQKFADREGTITEIKGIKKIESLDSYHKLTINKKVGEKNKFSAKGGKAIFNLFLCNSDRAKLLADIRRVEQMVKIKVK